MDSSIFSSKYRSCNLDSETAKLVNSDSIQVGDCVYAIGAWWVWSYRLQMALCLAYGILMGTMCCRQLPSFRLVPAEVAFFNSRGEVIGITSFKIRGGENINFAVPINYVPSEP